MASEDQEKVPKPINYRRSVKSQLWPIFAYLCVKDGMTPNQLIDALVMRHYVERKNQNGS